MNNNNGNNSFFNKAEIEKTKDKEKLDELDKKLKGCDKKVKLFIFTFLVNRINRIRNFINFT